MAEIIRIECDAGRKTSAKDFFGNPLSAWNGSDVLFQIALTQNAKHILASEAGSITAQLRYNKIPTNPIWTETSSDFETLHSAANWVNGLYSLAEFTLPRTSIYDLNGEHWLYIYREKNGERTVHLSASINILTKV